MNNRNWETDRAPNREANWNSEQVRQQPGWSSAPRGGRGQRPEQFQGNWRQPGSEADWREGFRGGFGNSGQLSESAYNRGGLGAGYWDASERMPGPGGEFGERGGWARYHGGAYGPESGYGEFGGGPDNGYPPAWRATPPNDASWAARGYGPRGSTGGFSGRDYDWTPVGEGPYSGRGPRGYQRSDERVHEDVCERLTEHGAIDASGIEVSCEAGEVTLEGTVPDRRSKRLAEEVAESARGVRDVHNRLRVSGGDSEQGRSFGTSEVERERQPETRREAASGRDRANADRNNTHDSELEQSTKRPNTGRTGSSRR